MPGYLKAIYLGAASLAVVAFILGLYELVIVGDGDARIMGDVVVPLGVFIIVLLLYNRRKKGLEARQQQKVRNEGENGAV